jgi:ElaA protein
MQSNITWQCAPFSDLSATQLYAILKVRSEVFVVEQNCVYQDIDGLDLECLHLIAWTSNQQVAAYLRILPPGLKYEEVSIGRVVSSNVARGTGIGKQLMAKAMELIARTYPGKAVRIQAQAYLENFYQSFGFITVSDVLLEDGIPHFMMLKSAS